MFQRVGGKEVMLHIMLDREEQEGGLREVRELGLQMQKLLSRHQHASQPGRASST